MDSSSNPGKRFELAFIVGMFIVFAVQFGVYFYLIPYLTAVFAK